MQAFAQERGSQIGVSEEIHQVLWGWGSGTYWTAQKREVAPAARLSLPPRPPLIYGR